MANLKELRNRIVSIGSTMQITSAMKMVSAAKLKKAQDSITQMRPYANKLKEILSNVSATLDASENAFAEDRDVKNVLLIVVNSNRGLCGAFNSSIVKLSKKMVAEYEGQNVKVHVKAIGKKAWDAYRKTDNIHSENNDIWNDLHFEGAAAIAEEAMNGFLDGTFDRVEVVYNHFKNAAVQEATRELFLPVVPTVSENGSTGGDYIYEPSKEEILEDLIPTSLKIQIFKALLDSNASEHGARMTAMHKATDNANDLKNQLTLDYNKARQAAITNEILEIVGGAEALNG
ncbi:MAG: ATP synthase F1 subunit gamma [Bacteroidetes bacterium]|uniref:ATP synthase gamma chain n=1 Tax=Phaeocystidibacter marisrubri TaxID=1577780 RepID=A0A6L3ZF92_9FLAO|nr:ATP synthase F1 subunit gamma [Phaeocystidibacter marisrubri]KAB2816531.1 ATP synthase F1 subunit gamma [Phaeocystidibacter marisrubri]TNE30994.1 MAG: ATP synthase F1 subunit gamma [Bacteroidota bacterium]GGH69526.1 ATP synthase gamma chain [Phaeocystidibacter marisrubri]